MDDMAFKIQLGVILPKMQDQIADSISNIFEEMVGFVKSGTIESEDVNIDEVKEMLIKDFDIFLTKNIIPNLASLQKEQAQDNSDAESADDETSTE